MKTRGEEKKENKGEEKNEQETKKNRERIGIRSKKNKKKHFQTSPGSMKHKECSPTDWLFESDPSGSKQRGPLHVVLSPHTAVEALMTQPAESRDRRGL